MSDFVMDKTDLDHFSRYFKGAPNSLVFRGARKSLDHLALRTTENDFRIINETMIVRNPRFVKSSLRVRNARGNSINSMEALAYSVKRERFTGWEEQQKGTAPHKRRASTISGRGGNRRAIVRPRARLRQSAHIYKPEQFQGRDIQARFRFMMRVLGTRSTSQFLLSQNIITKRGRLTRGLYQLQGHRIQRFQIFDESIRPNRNLWRTRSLHLLRTNNNLQSVWTKELQEWANRFR